MLRRITRRVVPLVGVVALLLNLAVVPQKARAVAVTAAVAASAAAILTACGVSYWAATQTDAIDYIAGKIDDYLDSIDETGTTYEDWLEISGTSQLFEVVSGGVMRFTSGVANKLLDFCRWFQQDEGIESDGDPVVDAPSLQVTAFTYSSSATVRGSISASIRGDIITIVMDNFLASRNDNVNINMLMPDTIVDGDKVTVTAIYNDVQGDSLLKWYLFTQEYADSYKFYGAPYYPNVGSSVSTTLSNGYRYLSLSISTGGSSQTGTIQARISADEPITSNVIITPSDFVNVPADISSASTFDVSPSVALSEGDSVDDAAQSILDGITSEDGLSSAVEETQETTWGWLYTLLSNIASTIGAGVSDIKDKLDGIKGSADNAASAAQGAATASQGAATAAQGAATAAQGAASAAQDAATAAQGVQDAVEGMQSTAEGIEDNTATIARNLAPATYGNVADYQLDLTSLFPFCIPRDIYTAIGLLVAEPEAPSIDWDMPLPNGSTYHIEYDLSEWDGIASLLRHLELLLYGVGLMMATKSIIKW